MKPCSACGQLKPLSEFYRSRTAPDGLQGRCKVCIRKASARWIAENPDRVRELVELRRLLSPEDRQAARLARRLKFPEGWAAEKRRRKAQRRRKKDRLAAEKVVAWKAQGTCPGCLKPFVPKTKQKPCQDHCHASGWVRAFLCPGCNSALGHAKDDPATLRRLANYLEFYVDVLRDTG